MHGKFNINYSQYLVIYILSLYNDAYNVTENINKFWSWGYWISPIMYGQNAIVVNELLGKSWRHVGSSISFKSIFCLFLQNHLMYEFAFL